MRFLPPDLRPASTQPLRPLEFYSERSGFPSPDFLSVQHRSEPSMHHVMAHARSRRRHKELPHE